MAPPAKEPKTAHRSGLGRIAWALGLDMIDLRFALCPTKETAQLARSSVSRDHGEPDPLPRGRAVPSGRGGRAIVLTGPRRQAVTGGRRAELGDSSRHGSRRP